jgi:vacuolar iron transporter family protein
LKRLWMMGLQVLAQKVNCGALSRSITDEELAAIYLARWLDPSLAGQVALQFMAHNALGAHASDELGISDRLHARPIQAALSPAGSFAIGAMMPLLVTEIAP